jgi:hypothetical protein
MMLDPSLPKNMADTNTSPAVNGLFNLANSLAVPFVQKLASNRTTEAQAETALLQERIRFASLNGSGPNDPNEAQRAPQGTLDFMSGESGPGSTGGAFGGGNNKMLWMGIAALGAVLVFLQLRK